MSPLRRRDERSITGSPVTAAARRAAGRDGATTGVGAAEGLRVATGRARAADAPASLDLGEREDEAGGVFFDKEGRQT
jgi:hypothetical protein